jgi:3-hydroxy-5-methyl-1-naphthoate 3-O-methyltransferase
MEALKQMKKTREPVTPEKFMEDLWAARRSLALIAAIELDVFTAIAEGKKTSADVARAIKAPRRGVERLLDAMVGLEYLTKRGSQYGLTPLSDTFLVRKRQGYLGAIVDESRIALPGWMQLTDVIRTGRPVVGVDTDQGREIFPRLVRAMFPITFNAARALVGALPPAKLKKIERVLDVAAGSAAWSLPFAQALPNGRVTVVDYPEVTAVAREYAQMFGVADRYDYLEGNLRQIDLGQKEYDLIILGHIIHSEGEKWGKHLLQKSYRALKPGATLVIAEMIPNDTRTGPALPLLFGLNMILHTNEGDVFTMSQYRQWLKQVGFTSIKTLETQAPSPLILATR